LCRDHPSDIDMVGMCLTVPITTGGAFTRKTGLRVRQETAKHVDTLDAFTSDETVARAVSMIDPA
jgi:mRNA interferase ChpB